MEAFWFGFKAAFGAIAAIVLIGLALLVALAWAADWLDRRR